MTAVVLIGGGAFAGSFSNLIVSKGYEKEADDHYKQAIERGQIVVGVVVHGKDGAGPLAEAQRILDEAEARPLLSTPGKPLADTVTLSYSEAGLGTPVVLLHGFPLSGAIWHEQQRLSDRYRVITPDLRGHGRSPAPAGVYEMDLMARDVLALLDALRINKAVVMGHSMGGYVALAAWKLAPERFLALGLVASQAGADTEEGRQGRYKMADKVAAEGTKVVAEAMLPKLFAANLPAGAPIIDEVRQMILNTPAAGIVGSLKGMAGRADSGPLLPNLKVPVLILTGDKDQIIPPDKAKAMAAAITTATLSKILTAEPQFSMAA
jgi:pimeloyl-ACP methyl ester carboxylesterase